MAAIDLFRIIGEPDRPDDGALLQRLAGAFDLQILDQDDGVAVSENIAGGIPDFGRLRLLRGKFGGRPPFPGGFVIDVIVVALVALLLCPFPRRRCKGLSCQERIYRGKPPRSNRRRFPMESASQTSGHREDIRGFRLW